MSATWLDVHRALIGCTALPLLLTVALIALVYAVRESRR